MSGYRPHVVILGGGFGGLWAARRLAGEAVDVTLIDRRNHHVFQPLLYQVATASLSPAQIAAPIRKVLAKAANVRVLLAEATAINPAERTVYLDGGSAAVAGPAGAGGMAGAGGVGGAGGKLEYDYLIVATGLTHAYFGHDEWAKFAPGLKSVDDALEMRRRFLLAFEAAEREGDEAARRAALTFVVVGGGPTGVELAGAMIEIARRTVPGEFRRVDTRLARVVLIEGQDRVLATFPPAMSRRALSDLQALGVEVRLSTRVTAITAEGVTLGQGGASGSGEVIVTPNVFWAAGVKGTPIARSLGAETDKGGRVLVKPDCSIAEHPEVFVIGDLASLADGSSGRRVPGVAPAAMQMGRYVAGLILDEVRDPAARGKRPAFEYVNKGELATIGRARAVGIVGFGLNIALTGWVCWVFWAVVHVTYLVGFRNKLLTVIDWVWSYLFFERGARLITGDSAVRVLRARDD